MKWLPTSAGPNQRAGLNEPPVSGPKTMTSKPSVMPIDHGAHSFFAFGLSATASTVSTSRKVPRPSTMAACAGPPSSLLTVGVP